MFRICNRNISRKYQQTNYRIPCNFEFFIRIMENYGFVLEKPVPNDHFDNPVDSFSKLHKKMNKSRKKMFELSNSEQKLVI